MRIEKPRKKRKKSLRTYQIVRQGVIERDNSVCQLKAKGCEYISGPPHHIILKSHLGADKAQNLICLCPSCHRLVHTNTKKYTPILLQLQAKHYGTLKIEDLKRRK
jgi:5-methylcytosine-specific restriction endonuclease McrA